MASNSFGNLFRSTKWGESHGLGIGVVIDGCPAGLPITDGEVNEALALRAPGKSPYTSPRKEPDEGRFFSGVFEGITTGAPLSFVIMNADADSTKYEPIKNLMRPGHANYTYLEKYGVFDYRGGGRSSARETACRVAGGAVARKLLAHFGVTIGAYIQQIGDVKASVQADDLGDLHQKTYADPAFCPEPEAAQKMGEALALAKAEGDSLGGVVEFVAHGLPVGLGDPVYEKLEANLAKAMMGLPASKGFEIGEGFDAAQMTGSTHNDAFIEGADEISDTNHAGGTLGGISTGQALICRVAFKPTSSITKPQKTVDTEGKAQTFNLPKGSRHDPCVAIRAVPVVEAMLAIALADALLMNRSSRL